MPTVSSFFPGRSCTFIAIVVKNSVHSCTSTFNFMTVTRAEVDQARQLSRSIVLGNPEMPPLLLTSTSIVKDLTVCAQNLKGCQDQIVRRERDDTLRLDRRCYNPIGHLGCSRGASSSGYPQYWRSHHMNRQPVPPRPCYNPGPLNPSRETAREQA